MGSLSFSEAISELMHNNTKRHNIISVSRQKEIILSHLNKGDKIVTTSATET